VKNGSKRILESEQEPEGAKRSVQDKPEKDGLQKTVNLSILFSPKLLTIFVLKDEERFCAKCVELDLITEMDTPQDALVDLLEIIKEYALDYSARLSLFLKSPNRVHHRPYIEPILQLL